MCDFLAPFANPGVSSLQRTYRMPKDIHVEPEKFAAELINRLEEVQKEREAEEKLEERLKRVRAVSKLLASCANPGTFAYCTAQEFFSCHESNLGDHICHCMGSCRLPITAGASWSCVPCAGLCEMLPAVRHQVWHSTAHFCHLRDCGALHCLWQPHCPVHHRLCKPSLSCEDDTT